MRGIDVHAKGALTEWHVDDPGNRISDRSGVGVSRYDRRERLHDLVRIVSIWAGVVFSSPSCACWLARTCEMVRPTGECSCLERPTLLMGELQERCRQALRRYLEINHLGQVYSHGRHGTEVPQCDGGHHSKRPHRSTPTSS
jgi:hypothetical protein